MMAAAEPSLTPEQSKMPRLPAMIGEQAIVSFDTSRRNWARGLRAPLWWFFQAMRVRTSLISSSSTPYFLQYAGTRRLKSAGAVSSAPVPSDAGRLATRAGQPESLSFSTPLAMALSEAPDATE